MKIILSRIFVARFIIAFVILLLGAMQIINFVLPEPHEAQAAINLQINYQGKLTNTSDVAVANGDYNMEFILYDAPSGGSTLWTETRTGANKVTVTNGLFSVMLGSVTALTSVDFNQTVYLGVNIGGTGTPSWDGEMTPRKTVGSVPSAFLANGVTGTGGVRNVIDSATALTIAKSGSNYALQVDTSTASAATGLKVTSAAAAGGLALTTISSGTNENLTIDAKGSGTISLGATSTGDLLFGGGVGATGCTVTNSTGALACTSTISSGVAGGTIGGYNLSGNTSGTISILPQAAAGTYNFNLPTTAGTSGYVLTSAGGGASAMTWTDPSGLGVRWNSIVAPTGNASIAMGSYTTDFTFNSATTGNIFGLSSSSLTTGNLVNLASTSTAAGSNTQTVLNVATSGANGTATQTTYGAQFANTHTGTTSTNVAAYFTASGGTNNYAAIFNAGNVGIGTTTPNNLLTLGNATFTANGDGVIQLGSTSTTVTAAGNLQALIKARTTVNISSVNNFAGIDIVPTVNSSASITTVRGGLMGAVFNPATATTLTNADGINWTVAFGATAAGAITNSHIVNVNSPIQQGTVYPTNMYGIQINNQGLAGMTNAYGLYIDAQSGATNNYSAIFAGGNVGIGDTTPAAALTVGSGDLFQVNSSGAIAAATGVTSSGAIRFSGLGGGGTQCVNTDNDGDLGVTACASAYSTWTSDTDADGYDLNDLSNILFRETTGAPTGTDVGLFRDNAGDLNLNALSTKSINLQVAGADEYNFSSTTLAMNSNTITNAGTINGLAITANTGVITTGTWQGTAVVDTYVADTLTVDSSSSVHWNALNNYPAACSAGSAISALADTTNTCTSFNTDTSITLQDAYNATSGNTITTTDARNLAVTLANVTTPTSFTLENQDTAATSAQRIFNSIATGTATNGLLIEQTGAGTMTNAIQIAETAGTITDGILITGTLGNILNSGSIDITGAGAITGATGFNGLVVTANTGVVTTGTWNGTAVASQYGGTGQNWSATSGLPSLNSGTWSANAITPNGVSYGGASNAISFTAQGAANTVLVANAGAPSFSAAITVGTSVTSPTINATTALQFNGANINTAGTLTNVPYLNQSNAFTNANAITVSSATAFTVAKSGANYVLQVSTNATGSYTGLKIVSTDNDGVQLSTIGGTNEAMKINALGTGEVQLGGTSTGNILLGGGSASTGCTVTNSTGALTCASDISAQSNKLRTSWVFMGDSGGNQAQIQTIDVGSGSTNLNIVAGIQGGANPIGSVVLTPVNGGVFNVYDSGTATSRLYVKQAGGVGIGTTGTDRALEINDAAGSNLRLTYNDADGTAANYADLLTTSAGALTIQPSGFIANIGGGATRTALRFLEPSGTGTDYAAIQSNANVTTSYTWTLPAADASGCIQSNGSGTLSISACSGAASLQTAYDGTNTITTTTARNIAFTLGEVVTPTSFTLENQDTAATSVQRILNSIASGTATNGLLIEQTGAGTLTNGIQIAETAGTITDGILITGTLGNILNSGSIDITGAGAITGATGYTQGSGTMSVTSANTTQVTTASALALNANSLTSGTGLYAASSTLTSGKLVDLQVSGTAAAASQTALNILTAGANATNAITTYGAQISNTHTNATSGTNIALYLNASGATTANYGLIVNAGSVGIGTTTPTSSLHVVKADNGTDDILKVLANNLTQGIGISYNTITAIGSNTDQNIIITPKGAGDIITTAGTLGVGYTPTTGTATLMVNGGAAIGDGTTLDATIPTNGLLVKGSTSIGSTTATSMFNVGTAAQFQVNSSGAIAAATGISSSGTIAFSGLSSNGPVYTSGGTGTLTTTAPTSGAIGYWSRTGAVLSQTTANDTISIANTTTTGADLALTNTGVYTGTGVFNLTANSATTGTLAAITGNGLTAGSLLSLSSNGTAAANNQMGLNISLQGANAASSQTTYGAQISNTHTGTGSVNYALQLTASGGAGANYALVTTAGNVQIGTGNVYIGRTDTTASLQIAGGNSGASQYGDFSINVGGGSKEFSLINQNASKYILFVPGGSGTGNSNVGINTTAPGNYNQLRVLQNDATASQTRTAVSAEATGAGATSVNVGLYATATGATNNYAAIFDAGNVGIGTTGPVNKLDVNGGMAIGTYAGVTSAGSNNLIISGRLGIGASDLSSYYINYAGGSTQWDVGGGSFRIDNGYINLSATGLALYSAGAISLVGSGQIDTSSGGQHITLKLLSGASDGASAVGTYIDTAATYSTAGSKLLSIRNNTTEKAFVGYDGQGYFAGSVGINTTGPDRKLDILDASNPQLRLTYTDGSVYSDLQSDSAGDLYLRTTGDDYFLLDNSLAAGAKFALSDSGNNEALLDLQVYRAGVYTSRFKVNQFGQVSMGTSGTNNGVDNVGVGVDADAKFEIGGNFSSNAWGLNGIQLQASAGTYTDANTAVSGTATNAVFNSFAQPTLAATNATVTTTNASTVYIANAPAAGTNQTITNAYALWVDDGVARFDGATSVAGLLTGTAGLTVTGAAVNLNASSNFGTNINTGTSTGTITLGGTAGNTMNIGTDNSVSDTINIGSALDNIAITSDSWSVTNTGALTVVSCSGCGGGATAFDAIGDPSGNGAINMGTTVQTMDWGATTTTDNLTVTSSGTGLTSGSAFKVTSATTGAVTNGIVQLIGSAAYTGAGGLLNVTANSTATGVVAKFSGTGLTTGTAINVTGSGATMTTGGELIDLVLGANTVGAGMTITSTGVYTGTGAADGLINVVANSLTSGHGSKMSFTGITTGTGMLITGGSSMAAAGELVELNMGSAAVGSGMIIGTTGTYTGTGILKLNASTATTGTIQQVDGSGLTSGTGVSILGGSSLATNGELIDLSMGNAAAGNGINILTNGVYTGTGLAVLTANSATSGIGQAISMTGQTSGTALSITGGGANMTAGGELIDLQMGAATVGSGLNITTTGAYTGAGILQLTGNSATTGTLAAITGNALTTGSLLSLSSSSTAATTGQKGLNVALTGALTGAQTTYGAYLSNTRTGASAVNVGLYASASGASGANYAAIFPNGSVGINTSTPVINLHVVAGGVTPGIGSTVADRGLALSGSAGRSRIYFEATDATSGQRVFNIDNTAGVMSFNSLNDAASSFVTQNILNILYSGNVGIGTSGPDRKLDVLDASSPQIRLTQADGTVYGDLQSTTTANLIVTGDSLTSSSAKEYGLQISPTINQTSTASYTALDINVTETAATTANGLNRLADFKVGGSSKLAVANNGAVTLQNAASLTTAYGGFGKIENHLTKSEEFDHANWTKSSVTAPTANTQVSPDGSTTAESLATSGSGGYVQQDTSTAVSSTDYTFSVWARSASGTQSFSMRVDGTTTGTGTEITHTATTSWQRFSVTQAVGGFTGNVRVRIYPGTSASTGTIYAWGAQVEKSSVPNTYAKTTTAGLTNDTSRGLVVNNNMLNTTASGYVYGGRQINTIDSTTAGTHIGQFIRMLDNTSLDSGQNVRGLEVQAYSGTNVNGTNTGIAAYGYTFGLQATTTSQAAAQATPAAIFADLDNGTDATTKARGNAIRAYTDNATGADLVSFYQETSTYTGNGLLMNFGNGGGSFSGNFVNLQNAATSKYTISSAGRHDFLTADADNVIPIYINSEESTVTQTLFAIESDTTGNGQSVDTVKAHFEADGSLFVSLTGTQNTTALCHANNGQSNNDEIVDCSGAPSDVAEYFGSEDPTLTAGEIVVVGKNATEMHLDGYHTSKAWIARSTGSYQDTLMGVISTAPAAVYGDEIFSASENPRPVALVGRVPVKVNLENGPIKAGDFITSSSTPGVGMKATKSGPVIGQALDKYDGNNEIGTIIVFIKPTNYNGAEIDDQLAGLQFDFTGTEEGLVNSAENSNAILEHLLSQLANLDPNNLNQVNTDIVIAGGEIITPTVTTQTLRADFLTSATAEGGLEVASTTMFNGGLLVDSISSIGDLLSFSSDVEFFGTPYFTADTAGFAVVQTGAQSVDVVFGREYLAQPIVSASISFEQDVDQSLLDQEARDVLKANSVSEAQLFLNDQVSYVVTNKSKFGFTIVLNKPATRDIKLSWVALAVRNATTFMSLEGQEVTPNDSNPGDVAGDFTPDPVLDPVTPPDGSGDVVVPDPDSGSAVTTETPPTDGGADPVL